MNIFGLPVYTRISPRSSVILGIILFVVIIAGYCGISYARHLENPDDKIVPSAEQLWSGIQRSVTPNQNGEIQLLTDTASSLRRFGLGVLFGSLAGVFLGVIMGLFPFFKAVLLRFVLYLGKVPPLAILPIIFIFAGIGEELKIILISLGVLFPVALDTYLNTDPESKKGIPSQQLVKALSLGLQTPAVIKNVVLPQIMPGIINTIRINLLSAWLFLIASEAIAADSGLGYRIFLVRRYLAMDIIVPYVFWIALLSFFFDAILILVINKCYPWYKGEQR
jgi:NitT/TauT family transport system permease protein